MSPVALSILIVIGITPTTASTVRHHIVQDPPPVCIGGPDGVNADLFKAGQEAAKRIVQAYSADKEFDPKDLRLMKASKVACAASEVRQAAVEMMSSNNKTIRQELIEAARDKGAKILTRYNSSDGDVTFGGSELRDLETLQIVMQAVDCLRTPAPGAQPGNTGSSQRAEEQAAAKRVVEAFNESGWNAVFGADDKDKIKTCRKPRSG